MGATVGTAVGSTVGAKDGASVGGQLGSVDDTTVGLIVGAVEGCSFVGNIKSARGSVVIGAEVEESDGRPFGLAVAIGAELAESVGLGDDTKYGGLVTGTLLGKVVPEETVLALIEKSKIERRKGTFTFLLIISVGALRGG